MQTVPKSKKSLVNRPKLMQQLFIGAVVLACLLYAFLAPNVSPIIKTIASVAVGLFLAIVVAHYLLAIIAHRGSAVAAIANEFVYMFLGIPIGVIAAGYLPVSIIVLVLKPESNYITIPIFVLVGVLQLLSIVYLIKRYIKDKGQKNLIEYFRYSFDRERRKSDYKRTKERTKKIDSFYSRFESVSDRIAQKREEQATDTQGFDVKQHLEDVRKKHDSGVLCGNC
ncbi:MAG: hypothetical protein KAS95_07390, partial [Candidatus Heimdallarchaeota archaeon]|nr:hypothetical protein [Candidatus Heimdallarchaeota archaeon]